jgi:hypothetical protein
LKSPRASTINHFKLVMYRKWADFVVSYSFC